MSRKKYTFKIPGNKVSLSKKGGRSHGFWEYICNIFVEFHIEAAGTILRGRRLRMYKN
jgi:hypothetical protein